MAWTTPRTWVTAEVVTASIMNTHVRDNFNYVFGSMLGQKICGVTLGGTQSTFDTSTILGGNIPSSFKNLHWVLRARGDTASGNTTVFCRMNNDATAANYSDERMENTGASTIAALESAQASSGLLVGRIAAATATAGHLGQCEGSIMAFNDTTFLTLVNYTSILSTVMTTGGRTTDAGGGAWNSTAALTRLTFFPGAGNFVAGSSFDLYGFF